MLSLAGTIVQGDILINGRRIGPFMHRISGYVYQDDLFIDTLTVLEHLTFMVSIHCLYLFRFPLLQKAIPSPYRRISAWIVVSVVANGKQL